MRVFIIPGLVCAADLQSVLEGLDHVEVCGLIVKNNAQKQQHAQNMAPELIWCRTQLIDVARPMQATELHAKYYEPSVRHLLSDPRTFYIVERIFRKEGIESVFNSTIKVEAACWNALSILSTTKPDKIFIQATPHEPITWVFTCVAELLGIPVMLTSKTVLIPWRTRVILGVNKQKPLPLGINEQAELSKEVTDRIERLKGDFITGMPDYEYKRYVKYNAKYWSWKAEISYLFKPPAKTIPFKMINSFRKKYCYDLYRRLAIRTIPGVKYVVFFPHVQPERTSLPEGKWYCQQWLIIRLLSFHLADLGWKLLVKEHPSTFRNPWKPGFRNSEFYRAVSSLPNVELASLGMDTYELIDGSTATATIAGTTIMESIVRGKPAFTFGTDYHKNLPGVMPVESSDDLVRWLIQINAGLIKVSLADTMDYLRELENNSFVVDPIINTSLEAYRYAITCDLSKFADQ
ncbi:MAG: hypothetical protein PHP44_12390 [Kiritimatiellae bacterium]|nr:hypothetical protein [Kiritimatiellia bacterium]